MKLSITKKYSRNHKFLAGFTLIELIIVIAILSVLLAITIPNLVSYKKQTDLNNNVQEFVSTLKLAQNKALSSENNSKFGVYLDAAANKYTLFKGATYASDPPSYQVYFLQNTMEFYSISLGGGNEIVFDKLTGVSEQSGSVSVRVKTNPDQIRAIYIANSGAISFGSAASPSDASRVKDSRHVQFTYSRNIDTANETITLTFDNSKTEPILISSYLSAGQLKWSGTVSVGGSDQIVEINTHYLNDFNAPRNGTLFSVRRDRRYNDKSLKITITGDSTGNLVQYSADGSVAKGTSVYVSNPDLQ